MKEAVRKNLLRPAPNLSARELMKQEPMTIMDAPFTGVQKKSNLDGPNECLAGSAGYSGEHFIELFFISLAHLVFFPFDPIAFSCLPTYPKQSHAAV